MLALHVSQYVKLVKGKLDGYNAIGYLVADHQGLVPWRALRLLTALCEADGGMDHSCTLYRGVCRPCSRGAHRGAQDALQLGWSCL